MIAATLTVCTFFILTQDFHVFPGALTALFTTSVAVPDGINATRLHTSDGETISIWRLEPIGPKRQQVVLSFHGNADSLSTFADVQRWFASQGLTNYAFEYRGYGDSTGFPSENGFYQDGITAIEFVLKQENIKPQDVIIFGSSIGTGPASYIASKYHVGTLVMLAPYTSLIDVVKQTPLFGYLHPFLWTRFPTIDFIESLTNTCVVNAHGILDTTIPYHHSEVLKKVYRGRSTYTLILSNSAGHNDILSAVHADVMNAILACIDTSR